VVYHVVNRATERQALFVQDSRYELFLALLAVALQRFPITLLAYCIMPNHWHLVLKPLETRALSAFMHWLTARHARHHRFTTGTAGRGHVYQGRFRSSLVERESYYWNVFRYVEANPVRASLVARAEEWKWGSLFERQNPERSLLSPPPVSLPTNWAEIVNQGFHSAELTQFREWLNDRCQARAWHLPGTAATSSQS
jgi:putative transposase